MLRRLYTTKELHESGLTGSAIKWAVKKGRLSPIVRSVYGEGRARASRLDAAVAAVVATGGVASGTVAGVLHGLDGVTLGGADVTVGGSRSTIRAGSRRRELPLERITIVGGIRCTDGLQTLVDLAAVVEDRVWEQALECVLRRRLATIAEIELAAGGSQRGAARMRRVLALRPEGARPMESVLETMMVQVARTVPGLGPPQRQVEVYYPHGELLARVDLAWPDIGLFIELDGQHHRDQPVYDASRETAVVALTGWLCGRFTWHEVKNTPATTARRLGGLAHQARRRPMAG